MDHLWGPKMKHTVNSYHGTGVQISSPVLPHYGRLKKMRQIEREAKCESEERLTHVYYVYVSRHFRFFTSMHMPWSHESSNHTSLNQTLPGYIKTLSNRNRFAIRGVYFISSKRNKNQFKMYHMSKYKSWNHNTLKTRHESTFMTRGQVVVSGESKGSSPGRNSKREKLDKLDFCPN